jgi:hypothetical protein
MRIRSGRLTMPWVVLGISVAIMALHASEGWSGPRERDAASSETCTGSNVAGAYGFSGRGTIVSNPYDLPEGPVATVGIITFDGQGQWVSHHSANVNGQVIHDLSNAGTYTVHPDCTFTFVDGMVDAVQFVGVFVADRQEGW